MGITCFRKEDVIVSMTEELLIEPDGLGLVQSMDTLMQTEWTTVQCLYLTHSIFCLVEENIVWLKNRSIMELDTCTKATQACTSTN